jgi:hypothetical protein
MDVRYGSWRIVKVRDGNLDKLIEFLNKNISRNGVIYKTKKIKNGEEIPLRMFFIEKKDFNEGIDLRIAFDTPTSILDYIQWQDERKPIRHSLLGRMIIFTKRENENYILISLKKTRSRMIVAEINKILKEDIIDFVNIDLPKSDVKNLTNFWASDIRDDHEKNVAASGVELEKGTTYQNVKQKRAHFSAVKTKSKGLNYGLSEEGLIWVMPRKDLDMDKLLFEILNQLRLKNVLFTI